MAACKDLETIQESVGRKLVSVSSMVAAGFVLSDPCVFGCIF